MAIEGIRIAQTDGSVDVTFSITGLLDRETSEHLERGVPATVVVDVELWRSRGLWFDRLESSAFVLSRIQYDVWDEVFEIDRAIGDERATTRLRSLDDVDRTVARDQRLAIADMGDLRDDKSYYLVLSATLQPLTLDDVDELEDWLSGGIKSGRSRGYGLLGFPKQLFGFMLSLTGLRDRNDEMRTVSFEANDVERGRDLARRD